MQQMAPRVIPSPQHFNIQIPFQTDSKGIAIATYWGSAKTEHRLYLDNHSPTWANNNIIRGNSAILKSKNFRYSTTTADGKVIKGDVYICDSISIGQVSLKNVHFYNISNATNAGKTDGVIGENIMSEGIWKIDFSTRMITFASSPDSIKGLQQANLVPAAFTSNAIEIEVSFRNNIKKKFDLDLGFNGCLILPAEEFRLLEADNTKGILTDSLRFSTPAGFQNIKNDFTADSIRIGGLQFLSLIATNKLVKDKLIGLDFFKHFEFVVIDYVSRKVYLSKRNECITCFQ